jgi:hypothetical protein
MDGPQFVGLVLVAAGILDAALIPFFRTRLPDERRRTILTVAFAASASLMVLLGVLFLTGFLGAAKA